jgi:hypothetical protein
MLIVYCKPSTSNFYENFMITEDVILAVKDVKKFIERLKELI